MEKEEGDDKTKMSQKEISKIVGYYNNL